MIKFNVEQGSNAWFDLKCGRITGTRFKSLMMGESTDGYKGLISDIVGELITGEIEEKYTDSNMQRGIDLEPEAREHYELSHMIDVEQVGFIIPDENTEFHEWIGISPDGLILPGMTEFKCPLRKTHLNYLKAGVFPNEYKWQVQGQLFVTILEFCDFMSYYQNMKPFIIRVFPDLKMHEQITERLRSTIKLIKLELENYNKL